jgi:hypothetical protein
MGVEIQSIFFLTKDNVKLFKQSPKFFGNNFFLWVPNKVKKKNSNGKCHVSMKNS